MTKATTATRRRRLNLRALMILGVVTAAALPLLYGLKVLQEQRGAAALLAEARRAVDEKQPQHALGYLNRYLEFNRDDLAALDLKSKLLAESVHDSTEAMEAIQVHTRVIALADKLVAAGKARTTDWLDARRRLVRLSVDYPIIDQVKAVEGQAVLLIEELKKAGKLDADALHLKTRALEETATYYESLKERQKALDEARDAFKQAEELEPGDVAGAAGLAQLYLDRLKEVDGAVETATEIIDHVVASTAADAKGRDPKTFDPKKHAAALLLRGKFKIRQATPGVRVGRDLSSAEREAQLRSARADLDEAFRLDPDSVDIRLTEADVALQFPPPDTVTARRFIETLPPEKRNNRNVKIVEARIDLADKRPDAAVQAYRDALLDSGGNDAEVTWFLVGLLLDIGRVDRSTYELIEQYERLARSALPSVNQVGVARVEAETRELDARCQYLEALYLYEAKQPDDALKLLEKLRKAPLRDFTQQYLYYLGCAYRDTGELAKARAAFVESTEVARAWAPPWLALARLDAADHRDQAVATLRSGLAQSPDDASLLAELADLLFRREMAKRDPKERSWSELEDVLNRAGQGSTAPSADVLIVRARYLSAVNRPQDAIALLETASRSQPRSVEIWATRINVEIGQEHFAKALELLDQAERPEAAGPQSVFSRARAVVLIRKGQVNEAATVLTQGLSRVPPEQRPELWQTLGIFQQARHDYAAARTAFEAWARLQPKNPEPLLALVDLAIAEDNDALVDAAVDRVKDLAGPTSNQWRFARIKALLRNHGSNPPGTAQLDQAEQLVRLLDAKLPRTQILQGQIDEKRGQVDKAIAAYTQAADNNGGDDEALNPLLALLLRENRRDAIEQVRTKYKISPGALNQFAAVQAVLAGEKGQAEQLTALAIQGNLQGFDVRVWQAQVLRNLAKPDETEAALRKRTTEKPGEPGAWFQLMMIQACRGNIAAATATLEAMRSHVEAQALTGPSPDLFWAQCYYVVGKLDQAVTACHEALRKQPTSGTVFQAVIALFDQTGQPRLQAEVVEMLQLLVEREKGNSWARRQLAERLAARLNDYASWQRALELIGPESRPNDQAADQFSRARVYAQSPVAGDRQKAIVILQRLTTELPSDATIHDQLGRLLLAEHQLEPAREHLARAAENSQASLDTILTYAGVLFALKDTQGVAAQLQRLERLDPNGRPVIDLKSKLLSLEGKPTEAAALLEKAYADATAAAVPDLATFGEAITMMLRDLGQTEAAQRVGRKLATTGPYGQCVLAKILGVYGKTDEAVALITEAGKLDPLSAGTAALSLALVPQPDPRWAPLADRFLAVAQKTVTASSDPREKAAMYSLLDKQSMVRHVQKRYAEEIALYQQMLALKPASPLFLNNMAWTLSEEMNNPTEAIKWADEAIKTLGPQPALLDTRGVVYTRLGKYDDALRDLDTAIRSAPSASYLYHLARTYLKMNRAADARNCRDRARAAGLTREQLQPSEQADWDAVMNL